MTYHIINIVKPDNPEYDGQVDIECNCGWKCGAHSTFAKAVEARHLTMNEQKGKA